MQAARPFADSSQIGQAAKRANAAYSRQLGIEQLPKKKSVDMDNNTNGMSHEIGREWCRERVSARV